MYGDKRKKSILNKGGFIIKIKSDVFDEQQIMAATFNEPNKEIFITFRCGATFIYGREFRQGVIHRERVITDAEFEKIKDYFMITRKCEVIA